MSAVQCQTNGQPYTPTADELLARRIASERVRVVDGKGVYGVYILNKNHGEAEWQEVATYKYGDAADDLEIELRQTIKEAVFDTLTEMRNGNTNQEGAGLGSA
tara:strand:+ start:62921 stop:63229 length:309 start_codon:yes stop_codon:yes gene_type:complete